MPSVYVTHGMYELVHTHTVVHQEYESAVSIEQCLHPEEHLNRNYIARVLTSDTCVYVYNVYIYVCIDHMYQLSKPVNRVNWF